jgi:transposase-like protein
MGLSKSLEVIARQRRWTAGDAEAMLAAAERSDLSLRAFAATHGMDVQRLYHWRKELRRDPVVEPVRFEELLVRRGGREESAAGRIEIVFMSGIIVRVGAGFDESTLRRLISILEQRAI